jgi:hypothetical protein
MQPMQQLWLMCVLTGLLASACGEPKATVQNAGNLASPTAASPARPATTRGVTIPNLEDSVVVATELPAVREDTGEIAMVLVGDDGGRGWASAVGVVIDGTGHTAARTILADPGSTSEITDALEAQARDRVAAFNARFTAGSWQTLRGTTGEWVDRAAPLSVSHDGLTYTIDVSARRLAITRGGTVVAQQPVELVNEPATSECSGARSYLKAAYVDDARKRAVVALGVWDPSHNCGGAPGTLVVVPLP